MGAWDSRRHKAPRPRLHCPWKGPWTLASLPFPEGARLRSAGSMKVSWGALPHDGLRLARRNDMHAGVQEGEDRGRADRHDGRQEDRQNQEKTACPGGPGFKCA